LDLRDRSYEDESVVDDVDFSQLLSDGVSTESDGLYREAPNEIVETDQQLSMGLGIEERACREQALQREAAPIIQSTVREAVKLNNERLKVEVNEVLAGEVGYRLDKYEKRRKFRERRDFLVGVFKWGIALLLAAMIFGNVTLRTRCQIVLKDIGDLVSGLIHNEEVTSNQLVEDLFKDLGEDLNQVNTETVEAE